MKLKYTIILLSLTTPLAAETDCLQNKNETLYEIISCLNKKEIDNARAITKKAVELDKHEADIKGLTDKLTTLAKKQNEEIVILNNKLVKLKTQLADKSVKEIAKQSGQLTTLARKHNLEIKGLTDKLRQVGGTHDSEIKILTDKLTNLTGKHDLEIKALTYKLTTLAKKQNEEIVILNKQVLQNQNKSSKLEQQLVDLNQALEQLKGKVVYFKQPFKLDSFKIKAFKFR